MTRSRQPTTLEELLDRVVVCPSGCWLWAGGDDGSGRGAYGRILRPGTRRVMPAHRYVHETFIGPIPFGYDVDHICAKWTYDPLLTHRCVNPDHLQAIPPRLNQQLKLFRRRGWGIYDMNFEVEPPDGWQPPLPAPVCEPILAPGETLDDVEIPYV